MKRILIASLVVLGVAAFASAADEASLVQTLASQLGVTDAQAGGGAGAILNYAKSALPTNEYAKVESAVPEAAELVKQAPAVDSATSAAGSALAKPVEPLRASRASARVLRSWACRATWSGSSSPSSWATSTRRVGRRSEAS